MGKHLGYFDAHLMGDSMMIEDQIIQFKIIPENRQGWLKLESNEVADQTLLVELEN